MKSISSQVPPTFFMGCRLGAFGDFPKLATLRRPGVLSPGLLCILYTDGTDGRSEQLLPLAEEWKGALEAVFDEGLSGKHGVAQQAPRRTRVE